MPDRQALRGDLLEFLFSMSGAFPGVMIETLLARMETGR